MHFRGLVCSLVLCAAVPASEAVLRDLRQYKQLITLIHNYYRKHERASDMRELVWDSTLQWRAERWSENCHWGHEKKGLGENLAYFWTTGPEMSPFTVILRSSQNWWKEVNDWTWSTDCGSACHYTQMVWAKTEKIGCALSKCSAMSTDSGSTINNANYFVCFYDPPGNYRGQYPYSAGQTCSQCDAGYTCKASLCSKTRPRQTSAKSIRTLPFTQRRRIIRYPRAQKK